MPSEQESASPNEMQPRSSGRRAIAIVVALVLLLACLLGIKPGLAAWARWMAASQLRSGAISEAQRWLNWSDWFSPDVAETERMRAVCFRLLGQMKRWEESLKRAQKAGLARKRLERELTLGRVRQGVHEDGEAALSRLSPNDRLPWESTAVLVRYYLNRNQPDRAKRLLQKAEDELPHEPHITYLWGVYWYDQGDEARALQEFRQTVLAQPRHELALSAWAKLLEKQDRLTEALQVYGDFVRRSPHSVLARIGLARVLRKLGRIDRARGLLNDLPASAAPSSELWTEKGAIELERSNYEQAQRWFVKAWASAGPAKWEPLLDAGTAFALAGDVLLADQLFTQADAQEKLTYRAEELTSQRHGGSSPAVGTNELQNLQRLSARLVSQSRRLFEAVRSRLREGVGSDLSVGQLYALQCAACHGANGDGAGRAARHLFPPPRDFRSERFRLVSTRNGVATTADIERVIQRGMPGTAMRAFDELDIEKRRLLAEYVLQLHRDGIRDRYVATLEGLGEPADEKDVEDFLESYLAPGEMIRVPPIASSDQPSIAAGNELYHQYGCASCHGSDGTGAEDVSLFDERGRRCPPRDLVRDPMKGGDDPESIYLRIAVGMPGSAHPAAEGLAAGELVQLVQYCKSLSREPKRRATNHERFLRATCPPLHLTTSGSP